MIDARLDSTLSLSSLRHPDGNRRIRTASSEARYRSLVDATSSIVWRAAPDGSLLEAPGSSVFTGGTEDVLNGWNWTSYIHPDDLHQVLGMWKSAIVDRSVAHMQHRIQTPDGGYRWVSVRAVPVFDSEGELAEWIGTVIDIHDEREATTALLESRTRLAQELVAVESMQRVSTMLVSLHDEQALFETILDAAITIMRSDFASVQVLHPATDSHPARLKLLANRGFVPEAAQHWEWIAATCFTSCGQALSSHRRVIIHDVHDPEAGTEEEDLAQFDACGIRSTQTTPLVSRAGTLIGMVSTHWRQPHTPDEDSLRRLDVLARLAADFIEQRRAVSEREQLLAAAESARREAESANKAKDEFLAVLSHELRSPMNAMLGWLRILKTAGMHDADLIAKAADTIERNIHVQAQVINDLLDVSRIMSGKLQLEQERVDLAAVVMSCVESLRPSADGKQVALRAAVEQDIDTIGDAGRLEQVVSNLVGNAIKFTPAGGFITVTVEGEGALARIIVEDTGPGIAPEFLPHLFERFRQADSSTTRRYGGLGLGLAIVKNVVELHGGTIAAESDGIGRGARFTVTLPLTETRTPRTLPVAPRPSVYIPSNDLSSVDILLVDDDADSRSALELAFEEHGAHVRTAASVRQALDAYGVRAPDVLISDIGMPGEDGYVLIRAIRDREDGPGPRTFAIAVTGFAGRQDREAALRAGFDEHVAKPVEPHVLFECVRVLEASRGNGFGVGG